MSPYLTANGFFWGHRAKDFRSTSTGFPTILYLRYLPLLVIITNASITSPYHRGLTFYTWKLHPFFFFIYSLKHRQKADIVGFSSKTQLFLWVEILHFMVLVFILWVFAECVQTSQHFPCKLWVMAAIFSRRLLVLHPLQDLFQLATASNLEQLLPHRLGDVQFSLAPIGCQGLAEQSLGLCD